MSSFFFICEFLEISPAEFFDINAKNPKELSLVIENLKKINAEQLKGISYIVEELTKANQEKP